MRVRSRIPADAVPAVAGAVVGGMGPAFGLALLCTLCAVGCGQQPAKPAAQPTPDSHSSGNPITAPVDYIGAVGKAQRSAERTVDLASLTRAIQMFQVQEDRLPRNLQELVAEGVMHSLPQPPANSEIAYDPRTGAVRIVPKRR